jgi:NAD-dependent dihydropyrimidine dehydrogenase PreA subunit
MKREIVKIDEAKCTGCGLCIPNCHEGALQIIDGKAVLVSELMCDGLGACLGHCPEGALEIEVREADAYNESIVMEEMIAKGKNVVIAHLQHMKEHGEFVFLQQGVAYLKQNQQKVNFDIQEVMNTVHNTPAGGSQAPKLQPTIVASAMHAHGGGCPGSQSREFVRAAPAAVAAQEAASSLSQWPVQMHLINPQAAFFQSSDLLVAADCVAFSLGNFHGKYLQGKKLAIACPKLDSNKEVYIDTLITLIDSAKINTLTVMIMEVPCCGGLLQLVLKAAQSASRKVPVKAITVSLQGEILSENWI